MGSSGSGSFSDYSNQKSTNSSGPTGGSSGVDNCGKAFSTSLDEVGASSYFIENNNVPDIKTKVVLEFENGRLNVKGVDNLILGYLPTKYNYIKTCLDNGFKYEGSVQISSLKPIPSITVDIVPKK